MQTTAQQLGVPKAASSDKKMFRTHRCRDMPPVVAIAFLLCQH